MKKYLLMPIFFGIMSFVKLEAAPMDAYYCFSTTEDAAVVDESEAPKKKVVRKVVKKTVPASA